MSIISLYQVSEHTAMRPQHSGRAETYVEDSPEEDSPGEDSPGEDIPGEVDSSRPAVDSPAAVLLAVRSRCMPAKAAGVENSSAAAAAEADSPLCPSATGSAIGMDEKHTVNRVVFMEMDHSGIRGRYARVGLAGMRVAECVYFRPWMGSPKPGRKAPHSLFRLAPHILIAVEWAKCCLLHSSAKRRYCHTAKESGQRFRYLDYACRL